LLDFALSNRRSCVVYPDVRSVASRVAVQAHQLIVADLPAAGRQDCWSELLPLVVTRILEAAIARDGLGSDIRDLLAAAARHAAREWIPLHECERACEIMLGCVCKTLWDEAEPGNCGVMLELGRWAADRLPDALAVVRAAYIEEIRQLGGRRDDGIVIDALLNGGDGQASAHAVGRPLPEPCAALAIACADGGGAGRGFSFSAPPESVLAALGGSPGALCAVSWERSMLIAVVGTQAAPAGTRVRAVRKLGEEAAEACAAACDRAFVTGLAMSDSAATAGRAVREAADVSAVLARSGRGSGAAFSEEVALDILIGTHDGLRRRIAERIADVASRPDLWQTLDALYRADLDRGRTARQLGIHRSTLDYRLNRVAQLAGISPTSVQGIQLFAAARAAISSQGTFGEPPGQNGRGHK
jgi:hypothetical protein